LLRLQPDLPRAEVQLTPVMPDRMTPLLIDNVPLAEHRLSLHVRPDSWELHGLPEHLSLTDHRTE
jgi:hypothetical protein